MKLSFRSGNKGVRVIKVRKLSQRRLLFTLGSKSPHKFLALCKALEQLPIEHPENFVETVEAPSIVNPQPFGREETLLGARNRAIFAEVHRPESIAVGVENGIFQTENGYEDRAVIVVRLAGLEIVKTSEGIIFPKEIVEEARRQGFERVTAGQVLAATYHEADPRDPHRFLTQGKTSRIDQLVPSLLSAVREIVRQHPRRPLPLA